MKPELVVQENIDAFDYCNILVVDAVLILKRLRCLINALHAEVSGRR